VLETGSDKKRPDGGRMPGDREIFGGNEEYLTSSIGVFRESRSRPWFHEILKNGV